MADNQTLADLLRQKAQSVIDFPTTVARNLSDPQAFLKQFGYTPNQQLSGFSAGYAGVPEQPPSDIGVLDPNNNEYNKGYESGEFAANVTPFAALAGGITKPFVNPVARALGEHAWNKTEKMMQQQGLMPSIVAYHGTPHEIKNGFDISKVGTGEGAQAYGHGMYFAESPEVANNYRINLSYDPDKLKIGNQQINDYYSQVEKQATKLPVKLAQPEYEKMEILERLMDNQFPKDLADTVKEMSKSTQNWFKKTVEPNFKTYGNLYKVDIPDEHIPNMLDWDKPLSQQPKSVQNALAKYDPDLYSPKSNDYDSNELGQMIYNRIAGLENVRTPSPTDSNVKATNKLNELGITGIRYLDEGSRSKGGTSNFVVFDPKEVKILEKNGQPTRKKVIEQAFEGAMPHYKDYENLSSVFEKAGLKIKETGSSKSNSKYVEIKDPVSGEVITARFANHPQSGNAMTLHGPADIEIGDIFKHKSWEDAINPILDRINKSRKEFGDELLTLNNKSRK